MRSIYNEILDKIFSKNKSKFHETVEYNGFGLMYYKDFTEVNSAEINLNEFIPICFILINTQLKKSVKKILT